MRGGGGEHKVAHERKKPKKIKNYNKIEKQKQNKETQGHRMR